jgi:hypothetical protein
LVVWLTQQCKISETGNGSWRFKSRFQLALMRLTNAPHRAAQPDHIHLVRPRPSFISGHGNEGLSMIDDTNRASGKLLGNTILAFGAYQRGVYEEAWHFLQGT